MRVKKQYLFIAVIAVCGFARWAPVLNVAMPCVDNAMTGPQWGTPCCCLLEGSADTLPSLKAVSINDLSLRLCGLPSFVRVLPPTGAPQFTFPTLASAQLGLPLYLLQRSLLI